MLFGAFQKRSFYRYITLLDCVAFIFCLTIATRAELMPVKHLTIADGLPQNGINKIMQDAKSGFFWFCTGGGLARFDGYGFANFTTQEGLPSDRVLDFLAAREGDYWLATAGGLVKFTPDGTIYNRAVTDGEAAKLAEKPTFITYPTPDEKIKLVSKLLQDSRGTIWVGTGNGLFRLERSDNQFKFVPIKIGLSEGGGAGYIYALYEDRRGAIWIGAENSLHRISPNGRITKFAPNDAPSYFRDLPLSGEQSVNSPNKESFEPVYFRALLEDGKGNFWVGTAKNGLFQFTVNENEAPTPVRNLTTRKDPQNRGEVRVMEWIDAIVESFDGKLWLSGQGGLFEYDSATDKFYAYTRRSGIAYHRYQTMFEDKNGNLWLGTRANGIFRLSRRGLTAFDAEEGISFIRSISSNIDGNPFIVGYLANNELDRKGARVELDIASSKYSAFNWHIGRFDEEKGLQWTLPKLPESLDYFGSGENQWSFRARNGEWWIATGEGLFRYPNVEFEKLRTTAPMTVFDEKSGLKPLDVFRLYEDSRGDVWISASGAGRNGLYKWERATEILRDLSQNEGLLSSGEELISAFGEDRAGNIWLGYFNRGAARLSPSGKAQVFDQSTTGGAPQNGVNGIFVDREGRVWLASGREGVIRIDDPNAERPGFVKITKAEGLSSNRTFAITQDLQGFIYIATDRDINRLNPGTGQIKILKLSDKQPQREFRTAFCARNGTLWFGTTEGLIKYSPLPETASSPPEVLLTRVEVEGKPQKISALGAAELSLPAPLAPDQNQLRIDFVSLAVLNDEDVLYQYKIEPQTDWSQPSRERFVNLAGLSAGNYKVLLRTVGSGGDDGAANYRPAIVTFEILSPVYLRWWFITGLLALAAFLIYIFYRSRLARLLEVEKIRTRIATDLHDDIGANLTRISLLSEVAKQKSGNGNGELLSSIADISRESVASMNDIVWAISPDHDSLLDLTRRMRRHAEEIFALRDIDLEFHAPLTAADLKLSVGVRRDVLLIFKEAVNNAARHSNCSRVIIDFRAENSILSLRIEDDGQGFNFDSDLESGGGGGHGLRSMKKRAAALGGNLRVDSRKGEGTIVEFQLSLARTSRV